VRENAVVCLSGRRGWPTTHDRRTAVTSGHGIDDACTSAATTRSIYRVGDGLDTVTIADVGLSLPMCRTPGQDSETTLTLYDLELILAGCWWTGRRSSTAG
jgi:hypothetical protein